MKPAWKIRKERYRAGVVEDARRRLRLLVRIKDLCWDIDVWLDVRPGTTFAQASERLGDRPAVVVLQREHARLLRQAALRGVDELEVAAA